MRRISLGGGFRYLVDSVAVGDGAPERPETLAAYYAASGTPPGVFLGSGLPALAGGRGVEKESVVTEEHLYNMLGLCCDPVTREPVGRCPNTSSNLAPVAGFDLTFSPSKSISVAWALADKETRQVIYDCHRQAVDYVLSYAEREVFHSRSGTNGIVTEDIDGVIAAAFTHFDSRAGDPQLHDHVVIWNRARSSSDGRWRTLDSRAVFQNRSALSSLHQGVLSDLLTRRLGVGWEARDRRHSERARFEIAGVPESLMAEFSQRVAQIEASKDDLIESFVADHGRQPTGVEIVRLRQQATIATRPAKSHRSLAEMTEHWRRRAGNLDAGYAEGAWVASLRDRNDLPLLAAGDLAEPILDDAARAVVAAVAERRATYRRDNLLDEAHRLLHGVRFASPDDRVTVAEHITDLAVDASLTLTPPPLHHTPERYLRPDGSSRLAPRSHRIYTTETLLDAEARLLESAQRSGAPTVTTATVARVTEDNMPGRDHRLSVDQAVAVEKIATSRRWIDVLVGPAGTGKSTTLAGLKAVWEAEHGPGSVIGLAPSAAAAAVLAGELGIATDNTAKWLTEHRKLPARLDEGRRIAALLADNPHSANAQQLRERLQSLDAEIARWQLQTGQLLIIDEAGLAGTFALDELVRAATDAGAKILLSGDWAQQGSVDAGGAFGLLARHENTSVAELGEVHRFSSAWERAASIELRRGNEKALDSYESHNRITGGTREELLETIYTAWKHDTDTGTSSLMIAPDAATVSELNRRARADRVAAGEVAEDGLTVAAGQMVGVGDQVVTRRNDRHLATGTGWVKNGDRWVVTATDHDGSMTVRRAGGHGLIVLPADYVAEHVELAYATTAHRSQGRTVGTAHALVSPSTTREALYVAATRGREANLLYVDTAYDPDPQTGHDRVGDPRTARDVLGAVLANTGAEASAHETLRRAQHDAESWTSLQAEYETLAQAAQRDRWNALLGQSGLTAQQLEDVRSSDAQGPLVAAFRRAEARGVDIGAALPHLVTARPIAEVDDVASVLHQRVERFTQAAGSRRKGSTNLIAGLVPRALNVTDPDLARALEERDHALQDRAWTLGQEAVTSRAPWLRHLGEPPANSAAQKQWLRAICTVAAYRERWSIGEDHRPLGPDSAVASAEQAGQRELARSALQQAVILTGGLRFQPQAVGAAVDARPNMEKGVGI
ncbi:MAG: MobF family relaxase [Acidimicrobiales bacterium]|jgi:conjugative relaxase-like TrwC/TraI family protein